MRFSVVAVAAALVASVVGVPGEEPKLEELFKPLRRALELDVQYTVDGHEEAGENLVIDMYNGERFTLRYVFGNNEPETIQVVGVGGAIRDPATYDVLANITDKPLGPLAVDAGTLQQFTQGLDPDMTPGRYVITPVVYVWHLDLLVLVPVRPQFVEAVPLLVLWFDPQVLTVVAFLVALVGGVGYSLRGHVVAPPRKQPLAKKAPAGTQLFLPAQYAKKTQ